MNPGSNIYETLDNSPFSDLYTQVYAILLVFVFLDILVAFLPNNKKTVSVSFCKIKGAQVSRVYSLCPYSDNNL